MDSFYYKFVEIFCGYVNSFVRSIFDSSLYEIHPVLFPAVVLLFIVLAFAVLRFIFNLIYRR